MTGKFMFDTVAINRLLDSGIDHAALMGCQLYTTHVQRDELENTQNTERRAAVLGTFIALPQEQAPTESSLYGTSRYGMSKDIQDDSILAELSEAIPLEPQLLVLST